MSVELGQHFKPDVQSAGAKLVGQGRVSIASGSDTGIVAYGRVSPPVRVRLSADDIASPSFAAECNCSDSKKGRLCKYVWATLLLVAESHPDFLSSKTEVETAADSRETVDTTRQAARAAEFRKDQYQKAKLRAKERKESAKGGSGNARSTFGKSADRRVPRVTLPDDVQRACAYFEDNGFPMVPGPTVELASDARRKLSHIFHPDKGGTHDEFLELNRNWETLIRYLEG